LYFDLDENESPEDEIENVDEERAKHRAFRGRLNEEREDILVYETEPLTDPLTFVGPISAVLYASSSAKDTDWFMRLSTVRKCGDVYPLVHGVIRARYRNSFSEPELLTPGEIYEYQLDLWQTGITISPGEKLRVEVTSASFPMFSRNLNTGGHNETETEYVPATQTIYHNPNHPSHILLPVIVDPQFGDIGSL
jgi:putative CocE/NonD family hydrolase